jgi:hypothetical protein
VRKAATTQRERERQRQRNRDSNDDFCGVTLACISRVCLVLFQFLREAATRGWYWNSGHDLFTDHCNLQQKKKKESIELSVVSLYSPQYSSNT